MAKPAGRYRRPVTAEQRATAAEAREEKLAGMHRELAEQVSALASGPQWRAWLEVAARFHNYSFNNTLLILAQRPDATQVAGYTLWQQLGRQVGKGERGIAILAPVTRRTDSTEDAADQGDTTASKAVDEPSGERRVVGFRPTYVWDVAQTSGDPLPTRPSPALLAGEAPAGLWEALAEQCTAGGFTVSRRAIAGDNGPNGYTAYATREVIIRDDVDDAQAVRTLAHELAHVLMHDPSGFDRGLTGACRGDREVEAESVAYLVAAEHGLDTSDYTFAYVAGWATATGDLEAALRDSGTRVLATAHRVLDATEIRLTEPTPSAAAAAVDADQLEARVAAGADRTAALRSAVATPAQSVPRERLLAANTAAAAFFADHLAASWTPEYLAGRLGVEMEAVPTHRVGYAPARWTELTAHLRSNSFSDAELLEAGLAVRARTGRLVDRFRDRLMFPIRSGDGEVVGFVGRRNPALDEHGSATRRDPKYLNTATTPLYVKGEHLYGLAENRDVLNRGGLAVLVEGPVDALAVDLASGGTMAGIAPLGTALTSTQAAQFAAVLDKEFDRLVVATDADAAGHQAAARAYELLTAAHLDPRGARLPAGLDPADTVRLHGPAALIGRLADAEPLARQVIDDALANRAIRWEWPEHRVAAAALAADMIAKAPPHTWTREVDAVADRVGLPLDLLYTAVMEHVGAAEHADADAYQRLAARDIRDDLHRGQHVTARPTELAALSARPARLLRSVPSPHGGHNSQGASAHAARPAHR